MRIYYMFYPVMCAKYKFLFESCITFWPNPLPFTIQHKNKPWKCIEFIGLDVTDESHPISKTNNFYLLRLIFYVYFTTYSLVKYKFNWC